MLHTGELEGRKSKMETAASERRGWLSNRTPMNAPLLTYVELEVKSRTMEGNVSKNDRHPVKKDES